MNCARLFIVVALASCIGCAATETTGLKRTIRADGVGRARAVPDTFVLSAAVTHMDKDLDAARRRTLEGSAKVLDAVKPFPIDAARSSTEDFSLHARETYQTSEFLGYEFSHSFKFVLTDVQRSDELTEAVVRAGATSSYGRFVSSKSEELGPLARVRAVQNARRKAEEMAGALGMKIGPAISIRPVDEDFTNAFIFGGSGGQADDDDGGSPVDVGAELTFVPPQTIEVTATVRIEFELFTSSPGD
ncbi:MAG: SIMPL domain-containing protein [Planctomycetes bacterium]|nr:SIMPL domain-containing protein [Planctomycetota bacterium]